MDSKSQFKFALIRSFMGSQGPTQFHTIGTPVIIFPGKNYNIYLHFAKNSSNQIHAKSLRILLGEGKVALVNGIPALMAYTIS